MGTIYAYQKYYIIRPQMSKPGNKSVHDGVPHVIFESSHQNMLLKPKEETFCGTNIHNQGMTVFYLINIIGSDFNLEKNNTLT